MTASQDVHATLKHALIEICEPVAVQELDRAPADAAHAGA